jgi:hypothetical protein
VKFAGAAPAATEVKQDIRARDMGKWRSAAA